MRLGRHIAAFVVPAAAISALAFAAQGCTTRHAAAAPDPPAASADPVAGKWQVPPSAESVKNPTTPDEATIAEGRKLYEQNCLACHGAGGKGDGPAAPFLGTKPGDLSTPDMWKYSDGNLFYKVTQGRGSMKGFASKLSDTQRWQIVDYIRTLAPKPAKQ